MASNEVRKLRRRMANVVGGYGQLGPAGPPDGFYEAELDRRRQYLAEELVKMGIEELDCGSFTDTHVKVHVEGKEYSTAEPTLTLEGWFLAITKAAKAAAEELYPELPKEDTVNVG